MNTTILETIKLRGNANRAAIKTYHDIKAGERGAFGGKHKRKKPKSMRQERAPMTRNPGDVFVDRRGCWYGVALDCSVRNITIGL